MRGADSMGREIREVYAKRSEFAIYLARDFGQDAALDRIFVQFSDDKGKRDEQITKVDKFLPLRDKLEYLCDGLHLELFYQRRLATALQLALDSNEAAAQKIMDEEIANATADRQTVGRLTYLKWATLFAVAAAATLITVGGSLRGGAAATGAVLLSAGGGALGALWSITMAITSRSVAPDHDLRANAFDGALRIIIGVLAGFAIHLFLSSGLISGVGAAGHTPGGIATAAWTASLAIGFAAGFLERLVPNLLTRWGAAQPGGGITSESGAGGQRPPGAQAGSVQQHQPDISGEKQAPDSPSPSKSSKDPETDSAPSTQTP